MIIKRILSIIMLCIIPSFIFPNSDFFSITLDNWSQDSEYKVNLDDVLRVKPYIKSIKKTNFIIPNVTKHKIYYLNIYYHNGFSKIYINDELSINVGSIDDIHQNSEVENESFRIPINSGENNIEIINYAFENPVSPRYEITDANSTYTNIYLSSVIKESIPIAFALITLLVFITISIQDKGNNYKLKVSLILFLLYFISRFLDEQIFLNVELDYMQILLSFFSWHFFSIYYIEKHKILNLKKITSNFVFMIALLSIYTITYLLNSPFVDIKIAKQLAIMFLTLDLALIVLKEGKNSDNIFKIGLILSLLIQTSGFIILCIISRPAYGVIQTGFLIMILSFYFNYFKELRTKLENSDEYSNKLIDSMDKLKSELSKKENNISDLKSKNYEIERDKSLFMSTLSRNLRTPLNSIIGYSENLYTTEKIEDVHNIVNELIIESDKMFQSINNVMDFSTRDFSAQDLLLKTFRMKEIFENSVYGSDVIKSFENSINFCSEKNSDKVLISGNPLIYKQIMTSVLLFIIELNPKKIDIKITNSGIDHDFMNLVVYFKGNDINLSDYNIKKAINKNRETFEKYIKLYGIDFSEKILTTDYEINLAFQCGLAKNDNQIKKYEYPVNIPLNVSMSVLVVEDYKPNQNIVKMHLTKMGCDVFIAENGDDAITIFKKEVIDVILMDIKMPIMDGWEATEYIRSTEKGLNTLIVGLTASSLDLDIRHCFESGMDDVLVKPIRKNQLYKKLSMLETYNAETFPSLATLQADYRLTKIESEVLFKSSITQIEKQLEMIDVLSSAKDHDGIEKEIPGIIHAALNINAFYYSRLLRNYFNAYKHDEKQRMENTMQRLKKTIYEVKNENRDIFGD